MASIPLHPGTAAAPVTAARSASFIRIWGFALLLLIVILTVLRADHGSQLDSLTVDEAWHIVAGIEYAREGDYRLNPEHPPLTKRWVGAFMPDDFRLRPKSPLAGKGSERDWVEETFYIDNEFRAAQQRARLAMFALNGSLLLVFGLLLWRAAGLAWATGTLAFLALEPTVGAHLPVVMTDLTLALALGCAALCAGLWIDTPRWRWALALGLAMGLALGAKHSALPGVAVVGALCAVVAVFRAVRAQRSEDAVGAPGALRGLARHAAQLGLAAALALTVLWAHYDFRFHAGPDGSDDFNEAMADKVAGLKLERWRAAITFADTHRLLPRAYLWGLADTVRAGVEGRGQSLNLLWGQLHEGAPPWFTFPSYIVSKLPLGLLALAAIGALALAATRGGGSGALRWRGPLLALVVLAGGHLAALAGSQGTYAGVRHALPVVVVLAAIGGAAFALAWHGRRRLLGTAVLACLVATAAMTWREPRLWEYHNELAGGSEGAWQMFGNEGLDLGQRAFELAAFDREHIQPSGQPMYSAYWFGEKQARGLALAYSKRVAGIDDTNVGGVYEGWFVVPMSHHVPVAQWGHDPAAYFDGLQRVARFGHVEIWRGRQVAPKSRAFALSEAVSDYIYKDGGQDWEKVAARSREVLAVMPHRFPDAIEMGNALLRLGRREEAIAAYRQPLDLPGGGVIDALNRKALETRVAALERGDDLASLRPLPNPWTE